MGRIKNIKAFIISIAVSLGTGLIASLLTFRNFGIYSELIQPPLSPPAWLFPAVWTILYFLMGVSAYMIYMAKNEEKFAALVVYLLQLVFNFLWLLIYFNLGQLLFAFVWLVILWMLILVMIVSFYRINKASGYLQIPYLVWVTFAGYLNLALYLLNR